MKAINYQVDRHDGMGYIKPFPGATKTRWRVVDQMFGLTVYTGKPSRQILEKYRRLNEANADTMYRVYVLDKQGWFLVMDIRRNIVNYNSWVGPVFAHYSKLNIPVGQVRSKDIDDWFVKNYGRKGEKNGIPRREAQVPQPAR